MADNNISLASLYKGWDVYQEQLVKAISPLAAEQLALRAAPNLRSVGMIAAHIVGARVRWFHRLMGEGSVDIHLLGTWDRPEAPIRSGTELVQGLVESWQLIQNSLAHWTLADLDQIFEGTYSGEEYSFTRQWIIWHVIEHDLHHGGEISLTLGAHGLVGLDI
ncbi:MAG TPA: DinB family protein [Ktedonobacteraceae bacterium]|nr:DinB family protein [Ktedonobacteraceae bacterium]